LQEAFAGTTGAISIVQPGTARRYQSGPCGVYLMTDVEVEPLLRGANSAR